MNTSEVLDRAADLVQERGWTTGGSGWPGVGLTRALCLEGGIMAALGQTFVTTDLAELAACPAYQAVQSYLGLDHDLRIDGQPRDPLWRWNDRRAKSAAEVVEVLRAAAMVERTREAAEQRVAVAS